jgi:hypothetical protein
VANTNTNVTLRRKHLAYKQTATALRTNPDLTVSELLKIHTKNYLKICDESGRPPKQQTIKGFKSEMKYLKKTFVPFKAYGYTDERRKRSLEVRQEARWTEIERVMEMKAEGLSHKQIAEELGIHIKTISRYLRELKGG